jgi:capsular exopolysaccharide synthesis family protein
VSISELMSIVRARWGWIVVPTILGIVAGVVLTALTPKTYESFTNIYITSQGSGQDLTTAYQGGLLSQERVKSYTELMTSLRLAEDVKNQLGLPDTPQQIADEISSNATVDTVLITLSVDSPDPQRSAAIANAAGTSFVRLVAEIEAPLDQSAPPAVAARIVQRAAPDPRPVSPSYTTNVFLGFLIGLALGLATALVVHRRDRSVKGGKQATELTGAPVIGNIPHDPEIASDPLPVQSRPRSATAESFRQVRTNLRFTSLDAHSTILVVTSSVPGEGKTTTSCNLAVALAKDGSRVVLVEADLRRPRVGEYLGLDSTVGLSTVLSRQAELDQVLQSWRGIMSVITSGYLPHDPSELLGSPAMSDLLGQLRDRFDVVVLDCTPLRAVTDSAVLAGLADGALMICRDGSTDAEDVARSAADLRQVSAKMLGLVMVGGRERTIGQSGYYDYESAAAPASPPPGQPAPVSTPPAPRAPEDEWAPRAEAAGANRGERPRMAVLTPSPSPRGGVNHRAPDEATHDTDPSS